MTEGNGGISLACARKIFPLLFSEGVSIETSSSVRVLFIIFSPLCATYVGALQLLASFLALLDFNLLFLAT